MTNLGLNSNPNKIWVIILNFVVILLSQLVFELLASSGTGKFPSQFELYVIVLSALGSTLIFFGINRVRNKE